MTKFTKKVTIKEKFNYNLNIMKQKKYAYIMMFPFALVFFVFTVLPVISAMYFGFTAFNVLQPPKFIGLDNYIRLFAYDQVFITAIKNTFVFAFITGPIGYLLCFFMAWALNELSPFPRSILTLLFYAPALSNIFVVWKMIFSGDAYGLINSYLIKFNLIQTPNQFLTDANSIPAIVILVILWSSLGVGFLAFIAGFQTLDKSLFEAGAVDGIKNRWQELWFITLPSMKSQLLFSAVMSIAGAFSVGTIIDGLVGFPSTNYSAHTIMNHLHDYGSIRFEMGYASAIATVLFLIMFGINTLVRKILSKVGQ